MSAFVEIARTGCASIGRHPIRSAVTIAAVLSVLVPYLVGMGLAEGIRQEALVAIGSADGPGAIALPDLYVAGSRFGRRVPVRLAAAEDIRRFEGVVRVIPRIVGRVTLGKKDVEAVLVGLPQEELAEAAKAKAGMPPSQTMVQVNTVNTSTSHQLHILPPSYEEPGAHAHGSQGDQGHRRTTEEQASRAQEQSRRRKEGDGGLVSNGLVICDLQSTTTTTMMATMRKMTTMRAIH